MRKMLIFLVWASLGLGLFGQPALPPPTAGFATAQVDNDWYLFGGTIDTTHQKSNELPTQQLWVFKAAQNMWFNLLSPLKNAPEARTGHNMEAIGQRLYVIGGQGYSGYLADLYCYDVSNGSWTNLTSLITGSLPLPTINAASAVVDGKIFMHGGLAKTGPTSFAESRKLYIFDPDSMHCVEVDDTTAPTMLYHNALAYQGSFYVFGCQDTGGNNVLKVYRYDPASGIWEAVAYNTGSYASAQSPPPFRYAGASMITLPTGLNQSPQQWGIFYGGGLTGLTTMDTVWGFCFEDQYWKKFDHLPIIPRREVRGFALDQAGKGNSIALSIFGGRESGSFTLSDHFERFVFDTSSCSIFLYDTAALSWVDTSAAVPIPQLPVPSPRTDFASCYDNGVWYIMGGRVNAVGSKNETADNELWAFHTNNNKWSKIPIVNPPNPCSGHQIAMINEKIFGVGGVGNDPNNHLNQIFLIDLGTNGNSDITQVISGSKPMHTAYHSALVHNDEVYVYGGQEKFTFFSTVIEYTTSSVYKFNLQQNIATYIYADPNNEPPARMRHGKVKHDGKFYYFGGRDMNGNRTNDVMYHDPQTNVWLDLTPMFSQSNKPEVFASSGIPQGIVFKSLDKTPENWVLIFGGDVDSSRTLDTVWGYNLDQNYWKKFDHLPLITGTGVQGFITDTVEHPGMVGLIFFGGRDLTTGALMDRFMKYEFDTSQCYVYTYDTMLLDWVQIAPPPPPPPFEGWMRVFLQGSYAAQREMNTTLNTAGHIPLNQPYNSGKMDCGSKDSLTTIPPDMVDWIMVELRSHPDTAIARIPAILMSDGVVLAMNGDSVIDFGVPDSTYYVAVHHRNHMPLMTADKVDITAASHLDFSDPAMLLYGNGGIVLSEGVRGMVAGDLVQDGVLKYSGSSNDRSRILQRILGEVGGTAINATVNGYYSEDLRMDGTVKYSGSGNDASLIIQNLVKLTGSNAINMTYTVTIPNPVYKPVKLSGVNGQ